MSPTISISLATESDASILASIMTAAFSTSDAAYPLIWGGAEPGTHDAISVIGLFTPVQRDDRVTFKAVDEDNGKVVGFVSWTLPKEQKEGEGKKEGKGGGLPPIPGVNLELWGEKVGGPRKFSDRDVDREKDLSLSFFFVHPDFQRRGVGSMLLQWAKEGGNELKKIWVTSTPQARIVYEKHGWKVVETTEIDLKKYGGEGTYVRYWMLRYPA